MTEHPQYPKPVPAAKSWPALPVGAPGDAPTEVPGAAAPLRRPAELWVALACWAGAALLLATTTVFVVAAIRAPLRAIVHGYATWEFLMPLLDSLPLESAGRSTVDFIVLVLENPNSQAVADVAKQVMTWVTVSGVVTLLATLAAYGLVLFWVRRGSTAARVWGTVLGAISLPGLVSATLLVWQLAAMFAWADLLVLAFASLTLPLAVLLNVVGGVFVWLPATNAHARARREFVAR